MRVRLFSGEDRNRMQRFVFCDYGSNTGLPSSDLSSSLKGGIYVEEEIRMRAMYTSHELAAIESEYIIAGSRDELLKRPPLPFTANADAHSHRTPLWPKISNKNEELLTEWTPASISLSSALVHTSYLLKKTCGHACHEPESFADILRPTE